MVGDDMLLQFESNARDYYSFQIFILNLLKHHIEKQKKNLIVSTADEGFGDAIAPQGFDSFNGGTLIDVKMSLHKFAGKAFLETRNFRWTSDEVRDIKFLLVIVLNPIRKFNAERFVNDVAVLLPEVEVIFWERAEIEKLINKNHKKAVEIGGSLFALRLENLIEKDRRDWKVDRSERVDLLRLSYERGQFSLFLGAGVSSSAGLPDWNTLINSMFVSYLTKEMGSDNSADQDDLKKIVHRLNRVDEKSALMSARYLRKGLSKSPTEIREFTRAITDNLYKLRDVTKPIASKLIDSISNLCIPRRTGAKVRAVITYNFDDFLERQLSEKLVFHHSIYSYNESYDPEELPVYHVHGFLPEDSSKYEGLDKSTLVFSEEGYHQIYSDAYHWSNLVQLTNLRENSCLMIGLSLTDPNLRRLLDISAKNIDRPRHFAFMRRITLERFLDADVNVGAPAISSNKIVVEFLNRHHKLNEEIMKELGVSIIWFESFEEIPTILERIIA